MESLAQSQDRMLSEFRLILSEWDLGIAADAMDSKARSLLIEYFQPPPMETPEQL